MVPERTDDRMGMAALLVAQAEKQGELVQTLSALLGEARSQAGCLEGMAAQDLGGQPRFMLYLCWQDQDALERYTGSEGFQVLLGASTTLLTEPARFRFFALGGGQSRTAPGRSLSAGAPARPHPMLPDIRSGLVFGGPWPPAPEPADRPVVRSTRKSKGEFDDHH